MRRWAGTDRLGLVFPVAAAAAWCSAAHAVMPPGAYAEALAAADTHVQIEVTTRDLILSAGENGPGHGLCTLGGEVVIVFRGRARPGADISINIPCRHEGADVPAGGTVFAPVAGLATAGFLEIVLVETAEGAFAVAGQGMGLRIISEPSTEPVIGAIGNRDSGFSEGRDKVEP